MGVVELRPVMLLKEVPVATPILGVTNVGDVAKTKEPDPVSSVIADTRLADDGVARNVATPVPSPDTPVEIGNPVAFVRTPDDGVPSAGVVKTGEVNVLFVNVEVEFSVTTFELLTVAVVPSTMSPFLTLKSLFVVATEVPYPLGYIKIMLRLASCVPLLLYRL